MKKLILITGLVVYSLFAAAMLIDAGKGNRSSEQVEFTTVSETEATDVTPEDLYVVKTLGGKIVVEDSTGKIIETTDTNAAILPESDRKELSEGITVEGKRAVRLLLEDLCS